MAGYRTWTPLEVITASNVQGYLQDQAVMVFASDSARSSAIVVPTEGMLTWLEDENQYQYYSGAAWEDLIVPITGGTAGQAYVSGGTAEPSFADVSSQFISTALQTVTSSYTAVANNVNSVIQTTGSSNITVTVPDVLEIGDYIEVLRNGSGSAVIVAGTGVSSWAGLGTAGTEISFYIDTQYAAAAVLKTGANEYRVLGRISK